MNAVLGLLGILVFIVAVIGLAAGVTALVVKISPAPEVKREREAAAARAAEAAGES
ncbi:MAG: hypothetical protein QOH73_2334 [Gaiellaceae bacterium]|nr:hypothetical protein [Gaiellaceae bacterium]